MASRWAYPSGSEASLAYALFALAGAPAAVKRADGGRPQVDTPNMWGSTKDGMTWTNIATAGISMLLAGTTNIGCLERQNKLQCVL